LEFEIKRSFSDYKADFKKHRWKRWGGNLGPQIKEFYYTFPAELWHKREGDIRTLLPEFAGVLVVYNGEKLPHSKIVREAKINNNAKPFNKDQLYEVARLGMIRIWDLKRRLVE